jgi:GNAT superfamily N-acetyltransferase
VKQPPKERLPWLQPEHFKGLQTQLKKGGITFSERIGHEVREFECPRIGKSYGETEEYLTRLAATRSFSKIVVNPRKPSTKALLAKLRGAQRRATPNERIAINSGLPNRYDRRWKCDLASGYDGERQRLVVVAYDPVRAVGYAGMNVALLHISGEHEVTLHFTLDLVYVVPQRRGSGYGLDLSIACGLICRDLLEATYRAVPAGTTITPCIYADYESPQGEAFTTHLHSCLALLVDRLREHVKRKSIRLGDVELDAGY